jgi:hypothetical protein
LWQYLEYKKEGKLLHKAVEKGVVNIAKYYHYKTICVNGQNNNIFNIYKGLDITKATNYKLEGLIILLKPAKVQISIKKGRNFNRKKSSSYTKLLPSKYTYLSSLNKLLIQN